MDTNQPSTREQDLRTARRLVIVEDNYDSREMLKDLLEEFGHEVGAAADGPAGIEQVLQMKPELALIDIGLPGIDGYEVARKIREVLGRRVFLVALTGYGQPEDRARALEAGFDTHLTKPVGMDALTDLLRRRGISA